LIVTIAALAAVLAVALIAASSARAQGDCTMIGTSLTGTTGNDILCGGSGADTMNGNSGNDELRGHGGNDFLSGGDGNDTVTGEGGNDTLIGAPGSDTFSGGSGNDRLLARDGELDNTRFTCGSGTDSLDMDLADVGDLVFSLGRLFNSGCENITSGAINEGPNVKISRHSVSVGEDGRAAVRLRCPASLPAPCAGTLRLGRSQKSQGKKTQYSIDDGKKETVSARLSQRDRNKLSQRGRITVGATSVEQGQHGDKTTVQTIKLIAQG